MLRRGLRAAAESHLIRGGEGKTPSEHGQEPRRYGLLLVILLASYLLSAFLHERWITELELALFTVAGLLALRNSPMRRRALRPAIAAGLLASAVVIAVAASLDTNPAHALAGAWTGLLLLATVTLLLRQILALPTVTIQSIYGVVSAYLIIGLMFAAFYSAIYYLHGRTFFVDHEQATASTFQYFSFTTLTTLGYGDFTAAGSGGRAVAMIEAMTGQIFLATLVARLVSAFRPQSQQPEARDTTTHD